MNAIDLACRGIDGQNVDAIVKSATSAATRTITKELTRDILGNLTK